jgi:outer membrane protein
MNRASKMALLLLIATGAAEAKDLLGVYDDALHNDPVIRQADANRLAARESRPQALSQLLPQINATAGGTRDHSSGFQSQLFETASGAIQPVRTADQIDNTIQQWALNLRQNIFSWSNWMALKAANSTVAEAEATYQAAEQTLILRVSQAYFAVLTADDTLEADQAALEAIARQLDQANKRFEVGLIAITDVGDRGQTHARNR